MGHTRMTTQGSEKQNQNNHPFPGKAGTPPLPWPTTVYSTMTGSCAGPTACPAAGADRLLCSGAAAGEGRRNLPHLSGCHGGGTGGLLHLHRPDRPEQPVLPQGEQSPVPVALSGEWSVPYASTEEILSRAAARAGLWGKKEKVLISQGQILEIDSAGQWSWGGSTTAA